VDHVRNAPMVVDHWERTFVSPDPPRTISDVEREALRKCDFSDKQIERLVFERWWAYRTRRALNGVCNDHDGPLEEAA
jgi:hypothetical protein